MIDNFFLYAFVSKEILKVVVMVVVVVVVVVVVMEQTLFFNTPLASGSFLSPYLMFLLISPSPCSLLPICLCLSSISVNSLHLSLSKYFLPPFSSHFLSYILPSYASSSLFFIIFFLHCFYCLFSPNVFPSICFLAYSVYINFTYTTIRFFFPLFPSLPT